ncbi:MAG: leucine-rich repeat domain-containing protein [Oscillospiraceae bacterium]|nr:leucine-rich repeat domain-containing protein [Oscillospiraceae bacterium]
MAQTTESASTETKTNKEGVQIKGKDVILLNAPEVKLSPKTPLLTKAQDVAGAINELFQLDPGGGDSDYKSDPDWEIWKQLPEPKPNQVIYGIRIVDLSYAKGSVYYTEYEKNSDGIYNPVESSKVECHFYFLLGGYKDDDGDTCDPAYTIDWGDGTTSSHPGGKIKDAKSEVMGVNGWNAGQNSLCHRYTETGLYIVTVTIDEKCGSFYGPDTNVNNNGNTSFDNVRAPRTVFAKVGTAVPTHNYPANVIGCPRYIKFLQIPRELFHAQEAFYNSPTNSDYALQFINTITQMSQMKANQFANCYSLTENGVDCSAVESIANYAFYGCYSLRKLVLPNCTSIGANAFYNCYGLKSIEAPNCISIGGNAFYNCYALHTIKVADGCTFGSNAFYNCYSLYPHPDGSIN